MIVSFSVSRIDGRNGVVPSQRNIPELDRDLSDVDFALECVCDQNRLAQHADGHWLRQRLVVEFLHDLTVDGAFARVELEIVKLLAEFGLANLVKVGLRDSSFLGWRTPAIMT